MSGNAEVATRQDEEGGSRLWRGMRTLIFGEDHEATLRDKLEDAIDEADAAAPKRGDLSPLERQMLRNLLQFGDRTAGEIAVTRGDIVAVPATIAFDDLVAAFAEAEHSRLPVTGGSLDEVIGMIHIKDVFKAKFDATRPRSVEALLRSPLFVPESMGVLDLLARMRHERVHLAIVVDEFGGTEGLVTIEDVVEEIVGDIEDEHDEQADGMFVMLEDGLWEADARAELDEISRDIDARLIAVDDEVDTLGGLTFLLAGRILHPGESVEHPSGWRIICVDADARRMIKLRLEAPEISAKPPAID
jgi:CBS domain containing-hemolysin-like protein